MAKSQPEDRSEVYPKVETHVCGEGGTHPPIDAERAMEILGWKEEGKAGSNVKYGSDYLLSFKDQEENTVKVRCTNNVTNRPLVMSNVAALKQEILRGRWRMNGEPIILGRMGSVLNGQHQLVGLILADKEWRANPEPYPWKTPPVIEKIVTVGIVEDDAVVNTMDTCKPRSLADVIYRSPYFAELPPRDRRVAARMTDYAIRLLWIRTGENLDGFSPRRTHAESLDFLNRHERILQAVKFVMEEDAADSSSDSSRGRLSHYLPSGYCAALLYLFGAEQTDTETYLNADRPGDDYADFSSWDQAEEFFTLLAGHAEEFREIRRAIKQLTVEFNDTSPASRMAVLIKAWRLYSTGKPITEKSLALHYVEDEDGIRRIAETPIVGGLDIGSLTEMNEEMVHHRPDEERKEEIKKQKQANGELKGKKAKTKSSQKVTKTETTKPKKKKKERSSIVGKARWVIPPEGEPYRIRVNDVVNGIAQGVILQGFRGTGNPVSVPVDDLHEEMPVA